MNARRQSVFSVMLLIVLIFPHSSKCHSALIHRQAVSVPLIFQDGDFQTGLQALKENRLEAALESLTLAKQKNPRDARIRNFRGIVLARLGQTSEAAAEYQEAIRLDPRFENAYRNLGFLQWTERQLDQARETLERAVELNPSDSFAHYYLGRVQLNASLYAEAFRELGLSGVPWPAEPDFLMAAAAGYLALKEEDQARRTLHLLMPLSLLDGQAVQAASLLLLVHDNEGAIEVLSKLSTRQSPMVAPWLQFDLALTYLQAGKYENAVDLARICRDRWGATRGEIAQAWSLHGIAETHLDHASMAVNAFQSATALAPDQEEHWLNLTRELMELSRFADAISAAQEGIKSNPNSYALHLRLGAANMAAGHYTEAENAFRDLVTAGDPLPTSYIGLAQVLLRTGRAEESVSELTAARRRLGANFLISYFLGLSLDRAGKRLEAISAYQEAVQLNPNSSEARLGLGKVELASARVSDAIVELKEALRLDPANQQAKRLLSQAYRRAGDKEQAANLAEAAQQNSSPAQADLLGDFILPQWQMPAKNQKE